MLYFCIRIPACRFHTFTRQSCMRDNKRKMLLRIKATCWRKKGLLKLYVESEGKHEMIIFVSLQYLGRSALGLLTMRFRCFIMQYNNISLINHYFAVWNWDSVAGFRENAFLDCSHGWGNCTLAINQTDCMDDTTQRAYLFGPIFQLVQLVFFRVRVTISSCLNSKCPTNAPKKGGGSGWGWCSP